MQHVESLYSRGLQVGFIHIRREVSRPSSQYSIWSAHALIEYWRSRYTGQARGQCLPLRHAALEICICGRAQIL